jgi:hypothetical protein
MSIRKVVLSTAVTIATITLTSYAGGPPPTSVPEAGPGIIAGVYGIVVGCAIFWKSHKNK